MNSDKGLAYEEKYLNGNESEKILLKLWGKLNEKLFIVTDWLGWNPVAHVIKSFQPESQSLDDYFT